MDNVPIEKVTNSGAANLQFDKAEISTLKCEACKTPIQDRYFRLQQKKICQTCRDGVAQQLAGGSGLKRFMKATLYGSLAGLAGAGIYWAILEFTGLQIGLISILVGYMVGRAVFVGSEQRGGLGYQFLAVFITYTAIVSAYVPLVVQGVRELNSKQHSAKVAQKANAQPGSKSAATAVAPAPKAAPAPSAAESADEEAVDQPPQKPMTSGEFAFAILFLIGVIYALPFLSGASNIIGLVIIAFGLYQAWKLNARLKIDITGPFNVAPRSGDVPGSA